MRSRSSWIDSRETRNERHRRRPHLRARAFDLAGRDRRSPAVGRTRRAAPHERQCEVPRVLCGTRADGGCFPSSRRSSLSERGVADRSPMPTTASSSRQPATSTQPPQSAPPADGGWTRWTGWRRLTPWMLPVWLVGVLVCSLRLVLASTHTVALKTAQRPGGRARSRRPSRCSRPASVSTDRCRCGSR